MDVELTPDELAAEERLRLLEAAACKPDLVCEAGFNPAALIPCGVTIEHIRSSMNDFINFLTFMNGVLNENSIERLETMLMPANFSSIVGEFMGSTIPKYCPTIVKNDYHNGHPDLIPAGAHPGNSVQHASQGIEIKGSRYLRGWQGHNAEDTWLMVFCYASGRPVDLGSGIEPFPFRFLAVYGAEITQADWTFSGRSETSRRTITAGINRSGYKKMSDNWIYRAPDLNV